MATLTIERRVKQLELRYRGGDGDHEVRFYLLGDGAEPPDGPVFTLTLGEMTLGPGEEDR